MKYGSVCSGVEAATLAWEPLGWQPAFFSEIDKQPRAVLKHRWQDVPCHGDFTSINEDDYGAIDLLVGGTPCQDFSVAGLRKGITGDRGNLTLEFLRLAQRLRPQWLVWENVPGVLSDDGGKAFGAILGGMAELGYGASYRVLDAQYYGVAQRRRRVFVIGYLGDWRPPAAVLFESESMSGHPAPSRKAWQNITGTLSARTEGGGGLGTDFECAGGLVAELAHTLRGEGFDASEDGTGRGTSLVAFDCRGTEVQNNLDNMSMTLRSMSYDKSHINGDGHVAIVIPIHDKATRYQGGGDDRRDDGCSNGLGIGAPGDPSPTLDTGSRHGISHGMTVRRLTPLECERLQGMPDNHTLVPFGKKMMSDAARYKMIGNSMAVPCMRKLGTRIDIVNKLMEQRNGSR